MLTREVSAFFDPEGAPFVPYGWVIEWPPAGSNASLTSTDTVTTTFLPDVIGDYVVSLSVSDGVNTSIADEVFVRVIENLPPVAVINASPLSGYAPLMVTFDGSGSNDPENGALLYNWEFGDGAGSDVVSPSYTYTLPGTYTVLLTVEDDFGNVAQDTIEIQVIASNEPPTLAPYTATPAQGPAPLQVSFVANATDPDGDVLNYFWDFGDGNNSTEENPLHVFYDPGSYTVTLQVSDGEYTVSATLYIAVESPLVIEDIEAEIDLSMHHTSKLKLELEFSDIRPQSDDMVRVILGELILLEAPLADFKMIKPGLYIYKNRRVYAKLDFYKHHIKVSKRLKSSAIPLGKPVPVVLSFGEAMATDQVTLIVEEEHHYDRKKHRKHAKFCKRKSGQ